MPLQNLRRSGRCRLPPLACHAAPRRASGIAMAARGPAAGRAAAAGAGGPGQRAGGVGVGPAAQRAAGARPSSKPTDELDRLQFLGRAQPDVATVELLRYVDTLRVDDPRYLETLLELGSEYVGLNQGRAGRAGRRPHRGAVRPRCRWRGPAAMLLRGQWMQAHGEVSKAERQIIEASALLPPKPPDYLRLRLLMSSAYVKNRGGHYDEAMLRYNQALKLVDETGPTWRRIDLRTLIASVLFDAGQADKAAEINREQMRPGDRVGRRIRHVRRVHHARDPVQPHAGHRHRARRLARRAGARAAGRQQAPDRRRHGQHRRLLPAARRLPDRLRPVAEGAAARPRGQRPAGAERGDRQHRPGADRHEAQGRGPADGARVRQHRRARRHRHQHVRLAVRAGRLPGARRLPRRRAGGVPPVPPDVRRAQPAGSPARADRAAGELRQREPPARAGHAVARRQAQGRGDPPPRAADQAVDGRRHRQPAAAGRRRRARAPAARAQPDAVGQQRAAAHPGRDRSAHRAVQPPPPAGRDGRAPGPRPRGHAVPARRRPLQADQRPVRPRRRRHRAGGDRAPAAPARCATTT